MPRTTLPGRAAMATPTPTAHCPARNLAVIPSVFIVLGRRIATATMPRAAASARPARRRTRRLGAWLDRRSQRRQITKTGLVPITPKTFKVEDSAQDLASNVASVDLGGGDDVSARGKTPSSPPHTPCRSVATLYPAPCHDADQLQYPHVPCTEVATLSPTPCHDTDQPLRCGTSLPARCAGCIADDRLGDGELCWHPA